MSRTEIFLAAVVVGLIIIASIVRSVRLGRMTWEWLGTGLIVGCLFVFVVPSFVKFDYDTLLNVPVIGFSALLLALLWHSSISSGLASLIISTDEGESRNQKPCYSRALWHQKQRRFREAIQEAQKELSKSPEDLEGHLLIAELQAKGLGDLTAAEETIQSFCRNPNSSANQITSALYALADWHLQIGKDRAGARRVLEWVVELFPNTGLAAGAAQRLAHLEAQELQTQREAVFPGRGALVEREKENASETAVVLEGHLKQHPLDVQAREDLARVYADQLGRFDLAAHQLEEIIQAPNQPTKDVVHGLNVLADLQVRHGARFEEVQETLERILSLGRTTPSGRAAQKRLDLLKLELRATEVPHYVKVPVAEQNFGLKCAREHPDSARTRFRG